MKKKVKKFGVGGDILTGLGAGLAGYALYKKLKGEDKDDDKDEREAVGGPGRRPRTIEEQTGRKAEAKTESKEESREDYLAKKTPPIKETGTFKGTDTAEPDLDYKDKKAAPAAQPKKAAPKKEAPVSGEKSQAFPSNNDDLNRRRLEGLKNTTPATSGTKGTQDVGKALGISSGAKGTQTLGERIKGTAESVGKSVVRTPQQRMADAAREVEERRKKEREGMKRGGVVKSSASKRADGIAQRGKTRGRIC